jgi:hypothetical protein
MNSKAKGSAGERELSRLLRSEGYDTHRSDQRYIGGLHNPEGIYCEPCQWTRFIFYCGRTRLRHKQRAGHY